MPIADNSSWEHPLSPFEGWGIGEGGSGVEPVRRFNSETRLLLSQLLLDSTLRASLLHTANMDVKVIVIFALLVVVIHAPVSNGELLFNRSFANVYIIFALCIKLRYMFGTLFCNPFIKDIRCKYCKLQKC